MVMDFWRKNDSYDGLFGLKNLSEKIRRLKSHTKVWEINKKEALRLDLANITVKVTKIHEEMLMRPPDHAVFNTLDRIEKRKLEILKIEEVAWKLKSTTQWLKEGDLNTKCFHRSANCRKNKNSIWKIERVDGSKAI